jgi:toxin ParE1/3/4
VTFSARAEIDLEDIWVFSAQSWSVAQADDYIAMIAETLERASSDPGRLRHAPIAPYRIVSCRRHRAFVRIIDDGLFVTRILHMSMDERRHLP